jgi:predicted glycogen debranching enzyme
MGTIKFDKEFLPDFDRSSQKEFIETNNIGMYASTSLCGVNTRKYHGLLVARQPQLDNHSYVLVNCLHETVLEKDSKFELGVHQFNHFVHPKGYLFLDSFELEAIPTWTYKVGGKKIKKELLCVKDVNQTLIRYTLIEGEDTDFNVRPFSSFRRIHKLRSSEEKLVPIEEVINGVSYSLDEDYDKVYIQTSVRNEFSNEGNWFYNAEYLRELDRGYEFHEDLYSPGLLKFQLKKDTPVIVSIATSKADIDRLGSLFDHSLKSKNKLSSLDTYLERSAQQFFSVSKNGVEVGAGYHWFGRWGRDTFLSLPGLTIARNQPEVCKQVLKTMLKDLKGGLLTNIGVGAAARYNSADTSLWFFWALQEYVDATGSSKETWTDFNEEIKHILTNYKSGTLYNIHMHESGLLYGGQADVALTWMDAKVNGVPVTPRAGFTVELNALWYHAILFSLELAKVSGDNDFVKEWEDLPSKIKPAFKAMFWDESKGYLADACEVNKKDWSFRPNQVFATSLRYSVCDQNMSESILKQVKEKLLTPRGLRTLAQDDPKYISSYAGDQNTRDSSYHQGIVWPWLLGHFSGGYLAVFGDSALPLLREIYSSFEEGLMEYGIGSIAEIYNAEAPFKAKGTISQAWSVSELIRIKTLIDQRNDNRL